MQSDTDKQKKERIEFRSFFMFYNATIHFPIASLPKACSNYFIHIMNRHKRFSINLANVFF